MKLSAPLLFIFFSVVALLGAVLLRVQREVSVLGKVFAEQKENVERGLQVVWDSALLSALEEGILKNSYSLTFGPLGKNLVSQFFPTIKVSHDWNTYRKMARKSRDAELFLFESVQLEHSWDRVLGLMEFQKSNFSFPDELVLTAFEQTLFDEEAHLAYQKIFECNSKSTDVLQLTGKFTWNCVFSRVLPNGNVELLVPSRREARLKLLPNFLKEQKINSATLGEMPWEIKFTELPISRTTFALRELALYFASTIALCIGIFLFIQNVKSERSKFSRRVSFLNQVVHELKTPLAGLKLHAQLAQKLGPDEQTLENIHRGINRIEHMFNQILLLNPNYNVLVNLEVVTGLEVRKIIENISSEHGTGAVSVLGEFEEFVADKSRLELVLRNLISNGIKYGKSVSIRQTSDEKHTYLSIKDEGPGIASEIGDKVFTEFFRTKDASLSSPDGIGLGLYIAKKLSKEMGASLCLKNPGLGGAEFELSFKRSVRA